MLSRVISNLKRLALDCLSDAPPVAGSDKVDELETADAKRGGLLRRRSVR